MRNACLSFSERLLRDRSRTITQSLTKVCLQPFCVAFPWIDTILSTYYKIIKRFCSVIWPSHQNRAFLQPKPAYSCCMPVLSPVKIVRLCVVKHAVIGADAIKKRLLMETEHRTWHVRPADTCKAPLSAVSLPAFAERSHPWRRSSVL